LANDDKNSYSTLAVDLDHTLIKTDLLHEAVFKLLKTQPLYIFALPFWILRGTSYTKAMLVKNTPPPDAQTLPYRQSILDIINMERAQGKKIVLASASPQVWIDKIAAYLGVFDLVLGSTEDLNLKGEKKLQAIESAISGQSFSYIGDAKVDLFVWKKSVIAFAVNPSGSVKRTLEKRPAGSLKIITDNKSFFVILPKLLRVHQWTKNFLIFIPVLAGHKILSLQNLENSIYAFASFSCVASSVYIINDLFDLESDRQHKKKKDRPLASGQVSIPQGLVMVFTLFAGATITSIPLSHNFCLLLCAYFLTTLVYTIFLKRLIIVDIICLAVLYTLRIYAGGAADSVPVSKWLLTFSLFIFVSLAFLKRFIEINRLSQTTSSARGYQVEDKNFLALMGISSGIVSVFVLTLYISSPEITMLYKKADYLWLALPVLFYWICRIWLLAFHNEVDDDPVIFAIKDRTSWLISLIVIAIAWLAI
jgi:4-hydroxybenzoate polyprenyltransferase